MNYLRWTARLRFRAAASLYLITGNPEDRERMIERAADLVNCGEVECRVVVSVLDLAAMTARRVA